MKTRKTLGILLILTLCLSLFAACGKKGTTDEGQSGTDTTAGAENGSTDAGGADGSDDANSSDADGADDGNADADGSDDGNSDADGADDGNADVDGSDDANNDADAGAGKLDIAVAALKGPTAIGMIQVMDNAEKGEASNNYTFTLAGTADEISPKIASGELQMAAVPCNLASVLYNNTQGGVKIAAINTLGVLYIVETGEEIQTVEDLKGRTIYSTGKGTTPEYTLNELLQSAGLDPEKDVTIEYKSEASEVAAILSETDDAVAMLPQPFVTTAMMNNDRIRIALDVTKEWEALKEGSTVVTGVLVVNSAFAEEHPEAVAAFLEEYQASTDFVNSNVADAAALVEKFDIVKAAVAQKAIPYCNITLITGDEMQEKASAYLDVLFAQNPKSVGGTLPDDAFYLK